MAFALRITAKTKSGQEVEIEPSWWDIDQLRSTQNFKEDFEDYYLNYFLCFNKQTFHDIMESQENYRKKGIYKDDFWSEENDQTNTELDHWVQNLQEDSAIPIWIYEWESGLD